MVCGIANTDEGKAGRDYARSRRQTGQAAGEYPARRFANGAQAFKEFDFYCPPLHALHFGNCRKEKPQPVRPWQWVLSA